MRNLFINYFFNYQTIQVLFWTLIHSLWQGIVFAFFTAIILMSTKKSATALRYKLLSSVLILFIITTAITFCYEVSTIVNYNVQSHQPVIAVPMAAVAMNHSANIIEKIISVLQPYESLIVLTWFAIIIIKSIGLMKGLRDVYVLKHRQIFDAGEYWNTRLKILAKNSGIKKQIQLLKSAIAKVPMVVGYFKPVILFPAAALTALAPEEIEAILLHELAHIRRKDYLINIFQRIAEIIFFFNPAVLWMSSLIKEERENCCDDIAVHQTKNKKQFIHALISFQECNASGYAASFSGRKNFLLNRIKRIITNNNKTLSNMEKTFLIAGIVVTAFAAFAFSQHKQSSFKNISALQAAQFARNEIKKDTVPQKPNNNGSTYTIASAMHGKQYKLVEVNGKVTELYVDDVRIPDDKISDYNNVIKELEEKLKIAKQNSDDAVKAQAAALKAEIDAEGINKLAIDSLVKANVLNTQANELRAEAARVKMEIDTAKIKDRVEALKAEAELVQQKALTMSDLKNTVVKAQLEALKASQANLNKEINEAQIEKLAALANDSIMAKDQADRLAVMAKAQDLINVQIKAQSKSIKDQTDKIINEELKKQIEQLKQQNEELKQQLKLNIKIDSLHITPTIPQGA